MNCPNILNFKLQCSSTKGHFSITGMPSFTVSRESNISSSAHTKHSSSCCNFVQKVMPYHSNLERTALASCFTENCFETYMYVCMLIVHKSLNNIAPIYISELLKVYTPSRNLRSWGDTCRSFSVAAPILWNHLPTKLKSCHSKTRFN